MRWAHLISKAEMNQPLIPFVFRVSMPVDCSKIELARGSIIVLRAEKGRIHVKYIVIPTAVESTVVTIDSAFATEVF